MTENVLLIGGGGREHAMAWKLAQSAKVRTVFVAPGNGGTATGNPKICNVDMSIAPVTNPESKLPEFPAVVEFCRANKISLVAVGPEDPLALGLADALQRAGLPCFGPSAAAAAIEASKAFAKAFMVRWDIPTAKHNTLTDFESALTHVKSVDYPIVIKASGLAAGKGVILPESLEESEATLRQIMVDRVFGEAGSEVVIEERMTGDEASILAFTDGFTVFLMPPAQDHKRVFDGDQGPNTGGMGAYAPSPAVSAQTLAFVKEKVLQRAVDGLRKEGKPFVGVLYAGIMLTPNGPRTLEFNCRFGDPETQVLLPLLETDLFDIMRACTNRCLDSISIRFSCNTAATVVAASGGYPGAYPKGKVISLPSSVPPNADTIVFHAGTKLDEKAGTLVTSGGRVLTVTGVAPTLKDALQRSYSLMSNISFDGMQYRKDIGHRALKWFADHPGSESKPVRLGVLGSTRGSSLQPVIDAIQAGRLNATVGLVVANKADAFILERAKQHDIPSEFVDSKGKKREDYDLIVSELFTAAQVDLILLIGYMRIISPPFVQRWRNRIMNVHPSLLPAFAGGMDLQVHEAVIAAGVPETGCTIHWVDEGVDTGPIVVQKKCPVLKEDTPETLKARVQALEGEAFIEAIQSWGAEMRVSAL